jgi:hypothetical protein
MNFKAVLSILVFAVGGIAVASESSSSSIDIVQALTESGYHTNPPTPAGLSLTADVLDCSRTFFGPLSQSADCTLRDSRLQDPAKISGDNANKIIAALLQLGAKGSLPNPETQDVIVKSLSCYFDTLPQPDQSEKPTWNCIFEQ